MIKSMTGFGRGENSNGIHNFTVEIKTLNHRYNDIIVRLPKYISFVEESVKKIIKKKIKRGRVEVFINLEYVNETNVDVKVDLSLANSYKEALEKLITKLNIEDKVTLNHIISNSDIIKFVKKQEDEEKIWECLKKALEKALDKVVFMREEEGKQLVEDIKIKTLKIKQMVKKVEERAPEVVLEYKEKLKDRIEELLENKCNIDETKFINEVAFFADKSNINEEIIRLYSHINQIDYSLNLDEPIGRKLDFLIQEMNREINTIGSKSNDLKINKYVVEIKSELEKIREQIQNIE